MLGLSNILPVTGPLPLEDTMGMEIAVYMLQRSLYKGRYKDNLYFESVRKLRSIYSNIWHSSRQTSTTSVMVGYLKKTYVTSCSTYELWFEPFILGIYKRMGNEVYQDQVVILEGIHKLMEEFALAYSHNKLREEKE